MAREEPTPAWEEALRRWQWVSASISVAKLGAVLATFALVFVVAGSYRAWAYVAAASVVLLELAQWTVEREALRRAPPVRFRELYASLPLSRRDRYLVGLNLVLVPTMVAVLPVVAATMLDVDSAAVVVPVLAAAIPGFLALHRVWRRNSWLAVSRLPSRPRRARGRHGAG